MGNNIEKEKALENTESNFHICGEYEHLLLRFEEWLEYFLKEASLIKPSSEYFK
jgi:hypothetical protein